MKPHILGGLLRAVEDVVRNQGDAVCWFALDGGVAAYQKARVEEIRAEVLETERAKTIRLIVDDLVRAFVYYDRKESESLPRGEIEAAIRDGEITVDDIVQVFRDGLEKHVASAAKIDGTNDFDLDVPLKRNR